MAAFMRSVISKKIGGVFSSFKAVELLRNNTPTVLRLGILIRWSHYHQRLPVHQTLYCSTQNFPFTSFYQPCLHSSVQQACLQPLSILTSQETSDSSNSSNEENTEEMENLYKSVELKVKGHDDAVLNSYQKFVFMAAKELNLTVQRVSKPRKKIHWLTVLKSRHIYKKHRVQYEMRTYFRIIKLIHLTGSTADVFVEYIERNLPEGVALQVTKCALEKMPDHLQTPPEGSVMPSSSSSTASVLSSSLSELSSSSSSSSEDESESPKDIKD